MASNCQNIPELIKAVKDYEEIQKQNQARHQLTSVIQPSTSRGLPKQSSKFHPYRHHNQHVRSGKEFKERRLPVNIEGKKENLPKDALVCFKCKEHGHYARNCVYRNVRCFRCQQKGHLSKDCKIKQVSKLNTAEMECLEGKDEYHKTVYVEDEPVLAYLDLGSECSTLKQNVVRGKGWEIQKCDTKLVGFGNQKTTVLGKIKKKVKVSNIDLVIDIMVVEDTVQNVPMILGRNFLDNPNIEISKKWKTLEIFQKKTESTKNPSYKGERIGVAEVNVDESTKGQYKIMLINLMNEFRDCFAKNISELGKTELIEMKICLKEQKIIRYHPYKVAYGLKPVLRQQVDELLRLDVIQPSSSEYASPVLLVPKKNNEYRMCVDYRKLNAVTQRETFPVPNMEETLNRLANKKIFTTLDLLSGYHQIPVKEKSRHLTAFVTPEGHYEYKRVPFGLTNAPAVFMKLMAKVTQSIEPGKVITFMDNILIPSVTLEENIATLKEFLVELRKAGLTLNLRKYEFFKRYMKYLGHEISEHGIKPSAEKTVAVEAYKRPENAREVKQFLGLAGYSRRFVQGFSFIARPLNMLLKKDVPFIWSMKPKVHLINKRNY